MVDDADHYPVILEGFLKKRGGLLKTIKQRYFVAFDETKSFRIDYFDKKDGILNGSINCLNYEIRDVLESEPLVIILSPSRYDKTGTARPKYLTEREWYIICPTVEDRNLWCQVFTIACRQLNSIDSLSQAAQTQPDEALVAFERIETNENSTPMVLPIATLGTSIVLEDQIVAKLGSDTRYRLYNVTLSHTHQLVYRLEDDVASNDLRMLDKANFAEGVLDMSRCLCTLYFSCSSFLWVISLSLCLSTGTRG
jgi:PH domain